MEAFGRPPDGVIARWLAWGREALKLRPEEVPPLVAACLFQFAFVAGVAVLKAASNALLVGTKTLPLLYVGSSVATGAIAAVVAVSRPQRRWPPTMTFAGWVVAFLGLATLQRYDVPYAVEALYLAAEVYATTLSVRFWARIGELFDLRQSRRVLGLIGGIGMAGSVFGGFLTHALGERMGALRLVPTACLSLVFCLLAAPRLRSVVARTSAPGVTRTMRIPEGQSVRGYLLRDGFPRNMAIAAALFAALTAIADLAFRVRVKELLLDRPDAQTALFGGLSAVVGGVAMTTQLALTAPLLRRVGLFGYLSLMPLACALFAACAMAWPGLWPVYALKVVEQVGALSLTQTGMQLMYGPMPEWARAQARSAVDGFAKKAGYALAGLSLFAFTTRHVTPAQGGVPWLLLATVATALITLVVIYRLRAHYIRSVGHHLQTPAGADHDLSLNDGTARRVLEAALGDPDDGKVLMALELLSRDAAAPLDGHLVKLIEHRSAKVRAEAARLAGERGVQACSVRLNELAHGDEPLVREAAITSVAQLRPFTAAKLLGDLLGHPDLGTRSAAIAALVPLDPTGPAGAAVDELVEIGARAMPGQRAQVVRLLGRLGGGHGRRVLTYLRDPAAIVRKAACEAAGACQNEELIEDLLLLLVARDTRPDARVALSKFGDRVLGRVEALLNDRHANPDLRYRLPRLLREIGTPRALEIILFSNPTDDPFLQYRLSAAAARIREAHPDIAFDNRRALEAALRRLDSYDKLVGSSRDLTAALGPYNLLVRAVNDRLDQHLESAIRLSCLVAPQRAVQNAWNRFLHGDEKTRPYAVEMLEHLVEDRSLARRLTGALERWHRRPDWKEEGRIEGAPGRLLEFLGSRDVVLRAIAIATVHRLAELRARGVELPGEAASQGEGSGLHQLARLAKGPSWDVLLNTPPVIPEEGPVSEKIVEKVLFLEGCDIFGESDVDDLTAVAQRLRERTFPQGAVIFQENDPGDALFVLVEGRVKVEKGQKHLFELGPRDSFGETSLLDNKPRPASAKALSDVKVLVLERADFLDLVSDRVELLRGIFGVITRDLRTVLDAAAAGRITTPGLTPVSTARVIRHKTG